MPEEVAILERWMQIIRGDLCNSQVRLGDCLRADADAKEIEYWRGCIDTAQYILALMEVARERGRNV
jgi:hypothetical protein